MKRCRGTPKNSASRNVPMTPDPWRGIAGAPSRRVAKPARKSHCSRRAMTANAPGSAKARCGCWKPMTAVPPAKNSRRAASPYCARRTNCPGAYRPSSRTSTATRTICCNCAAASKTVRPALTSLPMAAPALQSKAEKETEAGITQPVLVELTVRRKAVEVFQHQPDFAAAARHIGETGLIRAIPAPALFFAALQVQRRHEIEFTDRVTFASFHADLEMPGPQIGRAVHHVPAATIETHAVEIERPDRLQLFIAEIDAVDAGMAEQEFVAEVRTLMIKPRQHRPRSAPIVERYAYPVVGIDQIGRRRIEIEKTEHRALQAHL